MPVYAIANTSESLISERVPDAALRSLTLAGHGRYRFMGLHVYDATLFTQGQSLADAHALAHSSYALALRYARDFRGEKIAERSDAEIARQGQATEVERALWLKQMKSLFPDVKKGDVLTGLHLPGGQARESKTRFYLNGALIGEIEGPLFAQCFFGIWLSSATSAPELKRSLLTGQSSPKS